MSTLRLQYYELSKEAAAGFVHTKKALEKSSLGKKLIELVYLRISQINGCAYCLEMHAKSLRSEGEAPERLDALAGWRVSHQFSERERAALAWAEAVTHIDKTGAPDEVFEALRAHFADAEITDLTFAISLMNAFNRMAISMRQ